MITKISFFSPTQLWTRILRTFSFSQLWNICKKMLDTKPQYLYQLPSALTFLVILPPCNYLPSFFLGHSTALIFIRIIPKQTYSWQLLDLHSPAKLHWSCFPQPYGTSQITHPYWDLVQNYSTEICIVTFKAHNMLKSKYLMKSSRTWRWGMHNVQCFTIYKVRYTFCLWWALKAFIIFTYHNFRWVSF